MVPPQNFVYPRKRKYISSSSLSSNPLTGRFTRSKTQLYLHCSRSGRAWPGRNPFPKQPHLMVNIPFQKPNKKTHQALDEIDATPDVSVRKICRVRTRVQASRRLSADGIVGDRENVGFVTKPEFDGNGCLSEVVESDVKHLDLGFKSSGSGLTDSDKELLKNDKDSGLVVAVGCFEQVNKKEISIKTEKDSCLDKRNVQNSGNRLGKVFKAPASFSYRRLLPFLTEMAKIDSGTPCNAQNMEVSDSCLPSFVRENSIGDKSEERNSRYSVSQNPMKGCDMEDPSNSSARTEGHSEVLTANLANNSSNEMDEFAENFVQTTPPDAAILDKFDIDNRGELGERMTPSTDIQLIDLKPPNIYCKEYACDSGNSQRSPSQKNNSSPDKTKPFLNRCSRSKIFKTSSFSYRRLLPYLMDVANSTSCASNIDQPPELKNNFQSFLELESSPSSGEDISVDSIGHNNICDKVHAEKEVSNECPIAPLIDASSVEIYPGNLSPFDYSDISAAYSDISAAWRTIATSEVAAGKPDTDLCVQLEQTVQQEAASAITEVHLPCHSETEIQHNGSSKPDRLVATSSSCTEFELLEAEPISEVSQLQPENGCHLMERATLNSNGLPVEVFDHHGIRNHSPTKGILKRNPRGCRGLCSCLNCSSFRLHAERSFEFSRNQLLDAEELAFGLIEELANLRNLLEKSAEDGCDVAAIKCNQLQAKEACTKALITEQAAKQRLSLLNEDMNVHCRQVPLVRPRVTFSVYNKERLIPMANYPR